MRYRIFAIALSVIFATLILPVSIAETLVQEASPGIPAVGETFIFGRYEQDNDQDNGMEPIVWRVLDIEDGAALLISEYNLDAKAYNENNKAAITWEACSLRCWLNDNFLSTAFTKEEQSAILLSAIMNEDNPYYGTDGGPDTEDRIFLLSIAETEKHFPVHGSGKAISTAYAKAQGAYISDVSAGTTGWWLRSPGFNTDFVASMTQGGQLGYIGGFAWDWSTAVRPALRLDMNSTIFSD